MANIISDKYKKIDVKGRDYPLLKGDIRLELKNVHNGKTEVIEDHNMITNALSDIFTNNYGGLLNYNNFANLYNTWLGGVLLFGNQLDLTSASDYGIPDRVSNPCRAHAGQTVLTDQSDDLTRGNPDSQGTVISINSTKLCWEWGTSAGNGTIASLGLTHSDTGSYGCGVASTAQASLDPFADIGAISRNFTYGNNANTPLAINGNMLYGFYKVDNTTVNIFKTPTNNSKFKLQGSALMPITDYTTQITATVQSCGGTCYYYFDFTNNVLYIWRVPIEGGTTLMQDVISLSDGTVTSTSITVTGARLWRFRRNNIDRTTPLQALVFKGLLYVYGYTGSDYRWPSKLYSIEIANPININEVDTSDFYQFYYPSDFYSTYTMQGRRMTTSGDILVHNNFLINGNKTFKLSQSYSGLNASSAYGDYGAISSPVFGSELSGSSNSSNVISVCKLYLATKYNMPSAVTKTSAQSMRVEYTLQEV